MRLLLDTHTFLWFIEADPRLSSRAESLIGDPENKRFLSVASIWEIAIKVNIGKLQLKFYGLLDTILAQHLAANQVELIPIEFDHAVHVHDLPFAQSADGTEHKDPFDRLIVSQALAEDLAIVSADSVLDGYGVKRIW
ncbi:MAG: type II toxin-antitoxin system VapC family toxin [Chthonomonadales bacterium]